jgi:hypothetical protein
MEKGNTIYNLGELHSLDVDLRYIPSHSLGLRFWHLHGKGKGRKESRIAPCLSTEFWRWRREVSDSRCARMLLYFLLCSAMRRGMSRSCCMFYYYRCERGGYQNTRL